MSLRWRLILGIGFIELILLTTLVLGMVSYVRDTSIQGYQREARASAQLFAASASHAILTYDLATIEAILQKLEDLPGVAFASVVDQQGRILSSFGDTLASAANTSGAERYFTSELEIESAGIVIGTIALGYDLSGHDALIFSAYQWGISLGFAEMIFIALATAFLCLYLTRELDQLHRDSATLSRGDFEIPIKTSSRIPEIRAISTALEGMRRQVRQQFSNLQTLNTHLRAETEQKEQALAAEKSHIQHNAEVFAVLGHEIRTPISVAVMLLKEPDFKLHRAPILHNLVHALDLVENLNQRAERDVHPGKSQAVELSDFVQELNIGLKPLFASSNIQFSGAWLIDWDGIVRMPTRCVAQIIRNLVKNATIHSSCSRVSFGVRIVAVSSDEVSLELVVSDDGKGIAPEDLERIFTPYVQLDSERPGTGLGLSVSRDLAHAMGGELAVESGPEGTCFTLRLAVEKLSKQSIQKVNAQTLEEQSDPIPGKRILIAEDNATIRMITEKMLTKAGAEVLLAENGQEALERSDQGFDLVLSDIHMPELNGIELARRLRERGADLVIVGVTAATIGQEKASMIEAGADGCLGKPFEIERLRKLLRQIDEQRAQCT